MLKKDSCSINQSKRFAYTYNFIKMKNKTKNEGFSPLFSELKNINFC